MSTLNQLSLLQRIDAVGAKGWTYGDGPNSLDDGYVDAGSFNPTITRLLGGGLLGAVIVLRSLPLYET